jgi:G:T-mismatch repair DNA endonuclease (very short patch repair protein)
MITCKICNQIFSNNGGVSAHIRYKHPEISIKWYNDEYVKRRCTKCHSILSGHCKGIDCNKCRDRTGEKNPFYGKNHSKKTKDIIKIKAAINSKKQWEDPIYREKVIVGTSKPRRESFKKEQSERITQWYINNPIQREIRSNSMCKKWKEERIIPNTNSHNDSKGERELREECKKLFPNKDVKKCTLHIDGKWYLPDIIIDDHYIIEYFGDYWHANPANFNSNYVVKNNKTAEEIWDHDAKRIKTLEDNGYEVLVIWQHEFLSDKKIILSKIQSWCNLH